MNIAIIGYGKMGTIIESIAIGQGHNITAAVDPLYSRGETASGAPVFKTIPEMTAAFSKITDGIDVALEFTRPDTALANIKALAARQVPVVAGTTGWLDRLGEAAAAVTAARSSLVWASNFSLGVNLFYRIAAFAAKLAESFPEYDVAGYEIHHNKKADSPSGTAKALVETVLNTMNRKTKAVYEMLDRPPKPEELHYASVRLGSVPGTHTLVFDSSADSIEITHSARNRDGLANGALTAACWLLRCTGPERKTGMPRQGVFTIDDVLHDIIGI
jgi:4-hydroxy-tetrahydrodipicolinate reductase